MATIRDEQHFFLDRPSLERLSVRKKRRRERRNITAESPDAHEEEAMDEAVNAADEFVWRRTEEGAEKREERSGSPRNERSGNIEEEDDEDGIIRVDTSTQQVSPRGLFIGPQDCQLCGRRERHSSSAECGHSRRRNPPAVMEEAAHLHIGPWGDGCREREFKRARVE